jgi:hypothetical protein
MIHHQTELEMVTMREAVRAGKMLPEALRRQQCQIQYAIQKVTQHATQILEVTLLEGGNLPTKEKGFKLATAHNVLVLEEGPSLGNQCHGYI